MKGICNPRKRRERERELRFNLHFALYICRVTLQLREASTFIAPKYLLIRETYKYGG
jgi:hypothetical protein